MANNRARVEFVTPTIVLAWPKLNKPDTKYKAEGEYVAKGVLRSEIPQKIRKQIETMLAEFVAEQRKLILSNEKVGKAIREKKAKDLTVREEITKQELDGETGEETGNVLFQSKMKAQYKDRKTGVVKTQKPQFIDAKCKLLENPPEIWGGTEAKLAVTAAPYYVANDNVCGVTFYLKAVQIIKLVSGRGGDAKALGFAEEDGFEGDESSADASSSFKDESKPDDDSSSEGGVDVEDF